MGQRVFVLAALCAALLAGGGCSDEKDVPGVTYRVGDYYAQNGVKGVVFKVSASGAHGLIVSLEEAELSWSVVQERTTAKDLYDGAKNQSVIAALDGWQQSYPAFAWCGDKSRGGGGWFLPAYFQLQDLYLAWSSDAETLNETLTQHGGVPITVNSSADQYFWTSTQDANSTTLAVAFGFMDGIADFPDKSQSCKVRAVHAF